MRILLQLQVALVVLPSDLLVVLLSPLPLLPTFFSSSFEKFLVVASSK
jgi:hypothetical protein